MTLPRSPHAVIEAWVEAFNRADVEVLAALYHNDAVNHQVVQEPVRGRDAIRAMFAGEFARATMVCVVEQILEDGEWGMLEWRDPRGLRGCGFFHVVDGLIRFQRGYWDRLSFLRQQGLPVPVERAVPVLPADDLESAKAFYVEALGFTVAWADPADGTTGIMGIRRGSIELTIDCPMSGHGRQACAALHVDDADALYDEWRGRTTIDQPPRDETWGARTFGVTDPAGNTIFVIGPPRAG